MTYQAGDKIIANISIGDVEGVVVSGREVYTWWRRECAILVEIDGFDDLEFIGLSQIRPAAGIPNKDYEDLFL